MFDKSKEYLQQRIPSNEKVLLALSGGSDSTLLFHLMLEWKIAFEVAHVDHGWRESSREEAKEIQDWCSDKKIICHQTKLSYPDETLNLEDFCRRERYHYFGKICRQRNLSAVILGHHLDDQVETILKRVFEGSHLTKIRGMQQETTLWKAIVIRPLLFYRKKEILAALKELKYPYFEDETNTDGRFLRGRMRSSIVPLLEKEFGKNFSSHLLRLEEQSKKVFEYFRGKAEKLFQQIESGPFGYYLEKHLVKEPLVFEALIQLIGEKEKLQVAKGQICLALDLLKQRALGKTVYIDTWCITFERDYIFFYDPHFQVQIEKVSGNYPVSRGWKSLWKGKLYIHCPAEEYTLAKPHLTDRLLNGKRLKTWLYEQKVPTIFRSKVPAILYKGVVIEEFLTNTGGVKEEDALKRPANHLLTIINERDKLSN